MSGSRLPRASRGLNGLAENRTFPTAVEFARRVYAALVGAGLPVSAVCQTLVMLDSPASSQFKPAPTGLSSAEDPCKSCRRLRLTGDRSPRLIFLKAVPALSQPSAPPTGSVGAGNFYFVPVILKIPCALLLSKFRSSLSSIGSSLRWMNSTNDPGTECVCNWPLASASSRWTVHAL